MNIPLELTDIQAIKGGFLYKFNLLGETVECAAHRLRTARRRVKRWFNYLYKKGAIKFETKPVYKVIYFLQRWWLAFIRWIKGTR